jgi:hypothetical protein
VDPVSVLVSAGAVVFPDADWPPLQAQSDRINTNANARYSVFFIFFMFIPPIRIKLFVPTSGVLYKSYNI